MFSCYIFFLLSVYNGSCASCGQLQFPLPLLFVFLRVFFFGLFRGWRIKFSFSMFSGLELLLSLLLSPSCHFRMTSFHLSVGLPIFWIHPLSSVIRILITTSSSVVLSTWPNHLSLIFSLVFVTHAFVLSSKSCSAFLRAQVSLPFIRTGLMTVLYILPLLACFYIFNAAVFCLVKYVSKCEN